MGNKLSNVHSGVYVPLILFDERRVPYSIAFGILGIGVWYTLHYVSHGMACGCLDLYLICVQSQRLRSMAHSMLRLRPQSLHMWAKMYAWIIWFDRFCEFVDQFALAASPVFFILFLTSLPVQCMSLYLTL